jgi:ligand-binding sensor domain-containing protein/signal transduction histidine kinase
MQRWLQIIFVVLTLVRFEVLRAQEIIFNHLTTENGLSQNNAWTSLKDNRGFMWFGTDDGLNRYDGYNFSVYYNHPDDSTSICSNAITMLYQDSKHRIWVGTKAGLSLYIPGTDKFASFFSDLGDRDNLIKSICEDDNKNIWIGTSGGLKIIDTLNRKLLPFISKGPDPYNLLHASMRTIVYDEAIWIAYDSGLVRYDEKNKAFKIFKPLSEPGAKQRMSSIFNESENLWIGSFENGLFQFDKKTKTFKNFRHVDGNEKSMISNEITDCRKIGNKIWVCTPLGLSILDPDTNQCQNFQHSKQDASSLSSSSVTDILEDDQGIIWIGSRGGINIYSPRASKFKHYVYKNNTSNTLSDNTIAGIAENRDGDMLIATDGGGLNIFSLHLDSFRVVSYDQPNPISNNKTLSVLNDREGGIWIGTWEGGLNYIDPKTKKISHFTKELNNPESLSSNSIFYLYEDSDGEIWICTWGGGICRLNKKTKKITRLSSSDKLLPEFLSSIFAVVTAFQDSNGVLWFGSQERGVFSYDKETNTIEKYTHDRSNPSSISVSNANVIFEDRKKRLWFGTEGGGLNLFDRNNKTFSHLRKKDGLPSDAIAGILEDDHGNLWISTSNGIAKIQVMEIDPKIKIQCKVYSKADGLQDRQFNRWAYCKSKNGYMFFGGPNGFNVFHPDSIFENQFKPPVFITGFSISNKTILPGKNSPLKQNISETKSIVLNYNQSAIAFDFVALNFIHSERNKYAYYLKNFDSEWNYVGYHRKATYTNLDPGEYVFMVKASNNDGIWSNQMASISITILPPFWKTLWFKGLILICLLLSIYVIYRIRVRYLLAQKIELMNLVKARTNELEERNLQLLEMVEEVAEKNNEIQTQNEELTSQKDHISFQRTELESAKQKLQRINERLELLVNQRTKQLRQTIKERDKTVMELDSFVYSASHDLIAPLKSIRGLVNIGKVENDYNMVKEYFHYVETSIDKLEKVIRSMVDFSRNTNLEVKVDEVDVHKLINEVIKTLGFWQEAGRIKFINNIPENTVVISDLERLKIIFQNIVSNGMKYADFDKPNSFIRFEYAENNDAISFTISDNGIGIPKENSGKIFHMYYRGTPKSDGSGLGLYIVKETLLKLNGEVTVKSVLGKETAFIIKIPKLPANKKVG